MLSKHGTILSIVTPDKQLIPSKNKRKITLDTSIIERNLFKKQSTQVKEQNKLL